MASSEQDDERGRAGDLTEAIDAQISIAGSVDWTAIIRLSEELRALAEGADMRSCS